MQQENRSEKEKNIIAVMVFVFDNKKNLLLLKRVDNREWEPVKGGVEYNESWQTAALRELREETGFKPFLSPQLVAIVDDELYTPKGVKLKINGHITYCLLSEVMPVPELRDYDNEIEHDDYKWISFDGIKNEKISPPIAVKFIDKIKNIVEGL